MNRCLEWKQALIILKNRIFLKYNSFILSICYSLKKVKKQQTDLILLKKHDIKPIVE